MSQDREAAERAAGELAGSVVPGTGWLVERALGAIRREWSRNHSQVMLAVERSSGMSREDVADLLEERPELVPPLTQLLHEATMTGDHEVLEAMAATFASTATGKIETSDCRQILNGIRNLDVMDIGLFRWLRERTVIRWNDGIERDPESWAPTKQSLASNGETPTRNHLGHVYTTHQIATSIGVLEYEVIASVRRLLSGGFVMESTSPAELHLTRYIFSQRGRLLCLALIALTEDGASN